jgi:predicted nucleic acid-binding protein
LDSSALVKLVAEEHESEALQRFITSSPGGLVSSIVARVEVRRAARHSAGREGEARAREVLRGIVLLELTDDVIEAAASIEPPAVRSLDAIHLASALSLEQSLGVLVTYDERLRAAAADAGVEVVAPT